MKLTFLGTGGGRYVTGRQKRRTAGIILKTEETQLHIDPGPGALIYANKELDNPEETEAVITSHGHPDHCNDAEPVIEMITECYENPGALFANETVLKGFSNIEKAVSSYHQNLCSRVEKLEENSEHQFKDIKIESQIMFHSDPKTQGLKISNKNKTIGFWTDTEYSEELTKFYEDCDTLVVYCARPKDSKIPSHTHLNDIPKIVEKTDPQTIILTHFGYKFLESDLEKQENWLKKEVDCKVVFAEDNMTYPGNMSLDSF